MNDDLKKAENEALTDKVKALSSRRNILEKEIKEGKNEFERSKAVKIYKID